MQFKEYKKLDKRKGEVGLTLPVTSKRYKTALNDTDYLDIIGYNPKGHPLNHDIIINHQCQATNNNYKIRIYFQTPSIIKRDKYWKYKITGPLDETIDEGEIGETITQEINDIFKLSSDNEDFRFKLIAFFKYCKFNKFTPIQLSI